MSMKLLLLLSILTQVYCLDIGRGEYNASWMVFETDVLSNRPPYQSVQIMLPNEVITSYGSKSEPSNIKALYLGYETVHYIPVGLDVFFPQLEALSLTHCGLKEITKDNLSQMPKLRQLDVRNNNLKFLAGNLFESTPQMEHIDFRQNPIVSIGDNLLAPLTKVTHALFENTCAIFDITPDEPNRDLVEYRIKHKCKTDNDVIMQKLAELLRKTEKIDENQQLLIVKQETLETKLKKIEDIVGRLKD